MLSVQISSPQRLRTPKALAINGVTRCTVFTVSAPGAGLLISAVIIMGEEDVNMSERALVQEGINIIEKNEI